MPTSTYLLVSDLAHWPGPDHSTEAIPTNRAEGQARSREPTLICADLC